MILSLPDYIPMTKVTDYRMFRISFPPLQPLSYEYTGGIKYS